MKPDAVVTRKGQTTIPIQLRKKYNIVEGSRLEVVDTGDGFLMRPKTLFFELAGSGAKQATPKEMKNYLDKLRAEDA